VEAGRGADLLRCGCCLSHLVALHLAVPTVEATDRGLCICLCVCVCARAQKSTRLGRPSVSPLVPRRPRLHAVPTLAVKAPLDCLHRSLPGSTCERELYDSFARMLPELLRFSSAARLLHLVPTELQSAHRAKIAPTTPQAVRTSANAKAGGSASASLWDGWLNADDPDHNDCSESADDGDYADEEEEQEDDTLDLAAYF